MSKLIISLSNFIRYHCCQTSLPTGTVTFNDDMPLDSQNVEAELQAFINFFATFKLSRPLNSGDDLNDGAIFYDILSLA